MKKYLSLFLVLIMLISIVPVTSYAKFEEELTFRGIPFGTKYSEVEKILKEDGVELEKPEGNGGRYTVKAKGLVEVAGHEMELTMKFVSFKSYKDDEPVEDCVLYYAGYYCGSDRNTPLFYDKYDEWHDYLYEMRLKIESLYGKYDKVEEKDTRNPSKQSGSYLTDYYWYGKNGTSIDLKLAYHLFRLDYTSTIYYEWEKGKNQVDKLDAEAKAAKTGGTNGL